MPDEITFTSVQDAVRWSEEVATLSTMKSTLGALLSKPGSGKLSKQDAIDIAQTVSVITSNCKPWKGSAMKAVYSGKNRGRDHDLGIAIASRLLVIAPDETRRAGQDQLIALGVSTVKAVRMQELYGKRYPIKRMARGVGISRERFSKAECWKVLRRESKIQLLTWLENAENEIRPELIFRGWML